MEIFEQLSLQKKGLLIKSERHYLPSRTFFYICSENEIEEDINVDWQKIKYL